MTFASPPIPYLTLRTHSLHLGWSAKSFLAMAKKRDILAVGLVSYLVVMVVVIQKVEPSPVRVCVSVSCMVYPGPQSGGGGSEVRDVCVLM